MKNLIAGIVVGILLTIVFGFGVYKFIQLESRVSGIEKFLNNAIQSQQQAQQHRQQVIEPKVKE